MPLSYCMVLNGCAIWLGCADTGLVMTQSGRVANLSSLVMGMLLWLLCCFDGFIAVPNVGWCVHWQLQNGSRRGYSHLKEEEPNV
jgi:hypothetical protein